MNIINEVKKLLQEFGFDPREFNIEVDTRKRLSFATARILPKLKKPTIVVEGGPTALARVGLAFLIAHELAHLKLEREYPDLASQAVDQHELIEFKKYEKEFVEIILKRIEEEEEKLEPTS
jgi:hypothetical protein